MGLRAIFSRYPPQDFVVKTTGLRKKQAAPRIKLTISPRWQGVALIRCLAWALLTDVVEIRMLKQSIIETAMHSVEQIIDPGRVLLHASVYVWTHAGQYPLQAWMEATEILSRARYEFEDEDRIAFVNRIEDATAAA
jgi:hypothetical protein